MRHRLSHRPVLCLDAVCVAATRASEELDDFVCAPHRTSMHRSARPGQRVAYRFSPEHDEHDMDDDLRINAEVNNADPQGWLGMSNCTMITCSRRTWLTRIVPISSTGTMGKFRHLPEALGGLPEQITTRLDRES